MKMNNKKSNFFLIFGVTFGVMVLGSIFTLFSVNDWYLSLSTPSWGPPNWAFRVVWPLLYALMAYSAWLVQKRLSFHLHHSAFYWYMIQLFFNLSWSFCFFVLKSPFLAFVDILMLLFSIMITLLSFGAITPLAGWLLFPYLLWVCYAAAINFMIWITNQ